MFLQPLPDLGVLVSGVIVTDQMQGFVFGCFPVDLTQKRQPFAVPMMGLTLGNDLAVQNIQRSEQCGSTVAFVIMSHGRGAPFLQRQPRLGTIQR
jgi:hypothetical protein